MRPLKETSAELIDFRQSLRQCLNPWGDALFELCDAMLCSPHRVDCVPALSLDPEFRRSHGSLYKALAGGEVDDEQLRRLLISHRPKEWPDVFAIDASTWARCDAETSPERGFHYSASHHSGSKPIVPGWSFQWISQLNWAHDSWTAPMDARRIKPSENATDATIRQILRLVKALEKGDGVDAPPMFVFDAGYDPIAIGDGLSNVNAQALVRISSQRVFHFDPAPPTGGRGRPPRHGARFALSGPATWTTPDAELDSSDPRYGGVNVQVWHGLHPKLTTQGRWGKSGTAPIVRGSVIRVEVEHLPKRSCAVKKTLWLWWSCGASRTSISVGAPTCAVLTLSTPTGSSRTLSAGPRPHCEHPSKPNAGRGSSSRPIPNYDSLADSSKTCDCLGRNVGALRD